MIFKDYGKQKSLFLDVFIQYNKEDYWQESDFIEFWLNLLTIFIKINFCIKILSIYFLSFLTNKEKL